MTRGWEIDSYSPMSDDRDCGGALAPSSGGGGSERNRFGKFGCQVAEAPIRLFFQSNILGPVCLPLPSDIPKWHAPPKVPVAKNTACLWVIQWIRGEGEVGKWSVESHTCSREEMVGTSEQVATSWEQPYMWVENNNIPNNWSHDIFIDFSQFR